MSEHSQALQIRQLEEAVITLHRRIEQLHTHVGYLMAAAGRSQAARLGLVTRLTCSLIAGRHTNSLEPWPGQSEAERQATVLLAEMWAEQIMLTVDPSGDITPEEKETSPR